MNPSTQEAEQVDLCKFKVSLDYRTIRIIERDKKKKKSRKAMKTVG